MLHRVILSFILHLCYSQSIFTFRIKYSSFQMIRVLPIILLFCSLTTIAHSQESAYDSIVRITTRELVNTDPEKALENYQYLYEISENDAQRIRSLNLKGGLLLYFGIRDEALNVFLESEKLAIKEKDNLALTRIYGYISAIHKQTNLLSASRQYLTKANEASQKIKDKSKQARFFGNIEHEIASIEASEGENQLSLEHLRNAIKHFKSDYIEESVNVSHHLYNSYGMMSDIYLRLKELDSSLYYLELAKKTINNFDGSENRNKGNYYNSLAKIYLAKNLQSEAEENFIKAKEIAKKSNYSILLEEVYASLSDFYKANNQESKADEYANLNQELITQHQIANNKATDILLNSIYKEQRKAKAISQRQSIVINLLIAISIILLFLLIWYINQKRKGEKKFQEYIKELNKNTHSENKIKADTTEESSYISKEREHNILESLNKLEESNFHLKSDVSLNDYASEIGVNQKYITYVIRKHWDINFPGYINQLRVNYIVRLIKSDSDYLQYKISYLAELCGFSSHSRFSANFKKVTGISPSTFIAKVRKENKQEAH